MFIKLKLNLVFLQAFLLVLLKTKEQQRNEVDDFFTTLYYNQILTKKYLSNRVK